MVFQKKNYQSYEELCADYRVEVPEGYNFAFDFLDVEAAADPKRPAMVHVDNEGQRRDLDLEYFSKESNRMANALSAAGIGRGQLVMLVLQRRVEFWVSVLALMKIGAVAVPSPHLLTEHDVEYRVNKAKIVGVICEDVFAPTINNVAGKCPSLIAKISVGGAAPAGFVSWEAIREQAAETFAKPAVATGGDDLLFVFFSSGTTGMPKMVSHDHTYPLGHILTGVYWHDLNPGDVHLTVADTGWGKAVWGKFFGQWIAGAAVFVWDYRGKFVPANLLSVMAKHKVTTFCAPPTIYRFLVRENLADYDLSSLRHCTTAGELLNDGVFHTWKKVLGLPIYEGYGQTESCLQVATFRFMEARPSSIGKPAPGLTMALLDENDQEVAVGDEGEICINVEKGRPVGLFLRYEGEPEKTAAANKDGWYRTGDKAWMDEDGYLWFLGRTDDLIKSSGYRIGPFEVESALVSHPAIVEAAVTAVPDPDRGQAVKATVVLSSGYTASEELTRELQDHVKHVTAPYKYPRIIEYVPELPKTISGKIKRASIREKDHG